MYQRSYNPGIHHPMYTPGYTPTCTTLCTPLGIYPLRRVVPVLPWVMRGLCAEWSLFSRGVKRNVARPNLHPLGELGRMRRIQALSPHPFHCWTSLRTCRILIFLLIMRQSGGYYPRVRSCWPSPVSLLVDTVLLLFRHVSARFCSFVLFCSKWPSCTSRVVNVAQNSGKNSGNNGEISVEDELSQGLYPRVPGVLHIPDFPVLRV